MRPPPLLSVSTFHGNSGHAKESYFHGRFVLQRQECAPLRDTLAVLHLDSLEEDCSIADVQEGGEKYPVMPPCVLLLYAYFKVWKQRGSETSRAECGMTLVLW